MKVVIFTNKDKDPYGEVTGRAMEELRSAGAECLPYEGDESVFDGAFAALSLGGDGTFLRCARLALPRGVPVVGVHLGHTGYLSSLDPANLEQLRGIERFAVKERSTLEARVLRDGETMRVCHAVNDVVFSRGAEVQTVSLELEVDGRALGSFLGDGVIVSTAIGSTGYALSAGGPVADPRLSAMLVTPICAHTSHDHAFVLSASRVLTVEPSHAERRRIFFSADGGEPSRLEHGERIELRVGGLVLRCMEPEGSHFFDNVRIHRL